jgi:protocatechuate 3,4-dioxygenase beta subunit
VSRVPELTRRRLVQLGLALPLGIAACGSAEEEPRDGSTAAARLAATPACHDGDEETAEQTEGPYFKPRSPARRRLVEAGMPGRRLLVTGTVLTTGCRPLSHALLDFWQADAHGRYDNAGFRLRGHQFTDARGRFRLETVVPGLYPGRTRHIHVKVQPRGGQILTTQLYFPGEPRNRTDGIYDADLRMRVTRSRARWHGRFGFVLDA